MKLTKISAVCLIVLCGCLLHGGTPEPLPKLEIISAIYGKAPETADITETIRKSVRYGMYLDFHNHPRWTGKNFKIPNADKKIHLVYKLGGERKELECRYNARIRLGALPLKFQFGTPEWIQYWFDFSGAALNYARENCPKCKMKNCITFLPLELDHLRCKKCGFIFSEETLPTTGSEIFEGMKLEYHQMPDGTKIIWKPILRFHKGHHAFYEILRTRRKDPETGRKRLDAMLAYGKFYRKHILRKLGRRVWRPGYPHTLNYGRLCHFGDYVFPSLYCIIYTELEQSRFKITPEERAEYRSLVEDIISEVTLPFIRQWRGMANPMGQAFTDCIRAGRIFPEAKFIDYYSHDAKGNPRILSGTDLVYETVQGRNGLENLVSTYWYSDGLMHEPTVAYQRMLAGGVGNALARLEGFQPPAGYDPVRRGYQPFPKQYRFLDRPELQRPLNQHWQVVFPNGGAIPFGDSGPGIVNKKPPQESEVYPGWGVGALRHGQSAAAAMNWGNLNDGHSHNDMLNLLYWGEGILLLNTTDYPTNEAKSPGAYWRNGTGAHNTVMIDGKNHERACGGPAAWGVTDHLKMMQGFADRSHPGAVLRRSAFLVNSRPGLPPYLVDFYQVDGGKESHDYFLLVQTDRAPEAKLKVISPELAATGKKDLSQVFSNAEKKNVYPFIRNPEEGTFSGNAELLWTIPHQGALLHLHGVLVPESIGKSALYTGDAPGIRHTGPRNKDPLNRTVKKVVWRREKGISERSMNSCFLAAFEYAKDRNEVDLKDVKRLNVSGTPASRAAEVTHGGGKDILLLSDGNGVMMSVNTSAGKIAFNGIAALLSLDRNGKLVKVTTTGGRSLEVNGKRIPVGSLIRGRLAGMPSGLSEWLQNEKDATVVVSGKLPREAIGNILIVKHRTGTTSYKITGVKALSGNRTELQLDRSARKVIAVVDVAPNRKDMTIISGGTHSYIAPGNNAVVNGNAYKIQSVEPPGKSDWKTLNYAALKLEKPLPKSGEMRFPVTEFSADDPYTVMTSRTVEFAGR